MDDSKRIVWVLAVLSLATACAHVPPHGCSNGHQCVLVARSADTPTATAEREQGGPLVGIAVSGGGSRAATFAEAVLEELAKIDVAQGGPPASVLEHVQYMSSVSGGSLATAYYVLNKPPRDVPILVKAETLSKDYADFFRLYGQQMRANWEGPLWEPILTDATGRAFDIAKSWDAQLFRERTFADQSRREAAGDSPYVILNGTSWDNGRRIVFTNLPRSSFSYQFVERTREYLRQSGLAAGELKLLDARLQPESDRFRPMTAEDINADLSSLKVSIAVASSASVPLLIGPVLYSVGEVDCAKGPCLHIGDGGMFDNQGVESLAQVLFSQLLPLPGAGAATVPVRKGLMIVIDGSYPMHDVNFGEAHSVLAYLTRSPSRVSDIMEERALGYQLLLWSILRASAAGPYPVIPGPDRMDLVYLRHIDAAAAIAAQPEGLCGWNHPLAAAEVETRLRAIPTRFTIDTTCDAPLLQRAARELVRSQRDRIRQIFATQ